MRVAVAAFALACGCVLDFESLRGRRADAGTPMDAPTPDVRPPEDHVDLVPERAPDDVGAPDVVTPADVPAGCEPTTGVRIRLAHMATGYGAVTLCMRRPAGVYAPVNAQGWPAAGVQEGQVSAAFPTTVEVTQQNEPWQFAVVPADTACASISLTAPPLAAVSAQLDPGDRATMLFTSQESSLGRLVGVLGILPDKVCTDCPPNSLDIRMVHAALGAATARLEFAINYLMPGGAEPTVVNVFFAQNVGYGGSAPVGDRGFDCDSAWYFGSLLPPTFPVGLTAFEVGGDAVADSARFSIKAGLIARARLATVYFRGDWAQRQERPEFVLCYDGVEDSGLTSCDRVAATAVPRVPTADAGDGDATDAGDGDAGDATPLDASMTRDAVAADDASVAEDIVDASIDAEPFDAPAPIDDGAPTPD